MSPIPQAPAAPPAPTPELPDDSNAGKLLALNGAFAGVALLVVILRIFARRVILKTFGVDDWLMIAAMVLQQAGRQISRRRC